MQPTRFDPAMMSTPAVSISSQKISRFKGVRGFYLHFPRRFAFRNRERLLLWSPWTAHPLENIGRGQNLLHGSSSYFVQCLSYFECFQNKCSSAKVAITKAQPTSISVEIEGAGFADLSQGIPVRIWMLLEAWFHFFHIYDTLLPCHAKYRLQ